jgi:hypothetical protein
VDRDFFYKENANMWRITDDFWDDWRLLKEMFWRCETWNGRTAKGKYPDCDMLPIGQLGHGFEDGRTSRFTYDEIKTMMSLWCLFGSPLMIGAELTLLTDDERAFLTNKELLRTMDGKHSGHQLRRSDDEAVWVNIDEEGSEVFIGLFNLSDEEREIVCDIDAFKAGAAVIHSAQNLKDVWAGRMMDFDPSEAKNISAKVPAHGVTVYRLF